MRGRFGGATNNNRDSLLSRADLTRLAYGCVTPYKSSFDTVCPGQPVRQLCFDATRSRRLQLGRGRRLAGCARRRRRRPARPRHAPPCGVCARGGRRGALLREAPRGARRDEPPRGATRGGACGPAVALRCLAAHAHNRRHTVWVCGVIRCASRCVRDARRGRLAPPPG